jgi:hypothetical protein
MEDIDQSFRLHQGADESDLYPDRTPSDLMPKSALEWYAVVVLAAAVGLFLYRVFARFVD